jgi:hypothetical protein
MKKSELKNGMVVELRDGRRYIVVGDELMCDIYFISFRSFDENLLAEYGLKEYDIMKIYNQVRSLNEIETTKDLLWKRPKEVIYTEGEIAILKALDVLGFERIERKTTDTLYATKYMVSLLLKYSLFQDIKRCETKLIKEMLEETNNGGIK